MNPIKHPSNNVEYQKPENWDEATQGECKTLSVTRELKFDPAVNELRLEIKSYWQPTEEEIASILAGKPVTLAIYGSEHPVVWVAVEGHD